MTTEAVVHTIVNYFQTQPVLKAWLFGSFSRGEQRPDSDVDILVDSGLHGLYFFGLLGEVCSAIKMPVDLIDIYQLKDDTLLHEAKETGITIYECT